MILKLAVISPEAHDPREITGLHAMFAAGLERYHLRKPSWSAAELETWLGDFSSAERARIVIHSDYALADSCALGGIHERDEAPVPDRSLSVSAGLRTRACHDLACLHSALGRYDAVLLSPIFPSISKSGYAPHGRIDHGELSKLLANRTPAVRRTAVFALGGIDEATTPKARELGFDGVAVLGAVWNSDDPVASFRRLQGLCGEARAVSAVSHSTHSSVVHTRLAAAAIMCLTQDGLPLSHVEQARHLCEAGARWVQLRMKDAEPAVWLATARAVREVCHAHNAIFVVNDSVEIAVNSNADGVHLGKTDLSWSEARRVLGPSRIVGGTVNNAADAELARNSGCLDYVGVGPWRFTSNKKNLAPVLGAEGVRVLIDALEGLRAWVIGGIEARDLAAVRATGAAGVAVSSALYRGGDVRGNFHMFAEAWSGGLNGRRASDAESKVVPTL